MVTQQTGLFQAIADPTRRQILDRLREGDGLAVNDIAARFDISRPAISKHLRVLHQAHLVMESREGRHRVRFASPRCHCGGRAEGRGGPSPTAGYRFGTPTFAV